MGVRVEVSARLIRWPDRCACCLGRANTVHETTHTRVTGKKVIRTDSRSWQVPYCTNCLDHVDAASKAKSITTAGAYSVLGCGLLVGAGVAFLGSCCCTPAVFTPVQVNEANRGVAAVGLVAGVAGSVGLALVAVAGAYHWYRQLAADARRRRKEATEYAESLASHRCCTLDAAVEYEGWYGSVHSFWFANPDYAEAVARANPGKVLGG